MLNSWTSLIIVLALGLVKSQEFKSQPERGSQGSEFFSSPPGPPPVQDFPSPPPDTRRYKKCHPSNRSNQNGFMTFKNDSNIFGCYGLLHDYVMAKGWEPRVSPPSPDRNHATGPPSMEHFEQFRQTIRKAEKQACVDMKKIFSTIVHCCDTLCYCAELDASTVDNRTTAICDGRFDHFPGAPFSRLMGPANQDSAPPVSRKIETDVN